MIDDSLRLSLEQSVIAGALLDEGFRTQAVRLLATNDFQDRYHRPIWRAILENHRDDKPVNAVEVLKRCTENGYKVEEIRQVIVNAIDALIDIDEARSALESLHEDVRKSKLKNTLSNILDSVDTQNIDDIALKIEDVLHDISRNGKTTTVKLSSLIEASKSKAEHVPLFFGPFKELIKGFQKQDLVVIAGRPSTGKTALALQLAMYQAFHGTTSGFISLEMSSREIINRIVAMLSGLSMGRLNLGYDTLMPTEQSLLEMAYKIIDRMQLYLVFPRSTDFYEITGSIMELKRIYGIQIAYVDYLQLMHVPGRSESRVQEIGHMTSQLKVLARTLDIPIVLLSQLSRAPEHRVSLEPRLSDLRDSGVIEQDADAVFMIHPLFKYGPHRIGMTEIGLKKNRNGPIGRIRLGFVASLTRHCFMERVESMQDDDDDDLW